ncbi:YjfB family protein [Clostridium saccharoperbutylacetonicum]|uniref:YjfB family protein n=1 Tax=Clostridium saccharoperbutylacetonicum TaxID=36745 RepID=UPI0039E8A558
MKMKGFEYMDIAAMSMNLSQTSVQDAASVSILKMAMNNSSETATQMTEMLAIDTTRGSVIDARA